jgi:excisionase family DNA binding protein
LNAVHEVETKDFTRITLTAKQTAEYIGCSYWQLLEMVKRHEIPAVHIGKRVLFREETLLNWMEEQETKSLQTEPESYGIRRIM